MYFDYFECLRTFLPNLFSFSFRTQIAKISQSGAQVIPYNLVGIAKLIRVWNIWKWDQKCQFYSGINRKIMIFFHFNNKMKIHSSAFHIHMLEEYCESTHSFNPLFILYGSFISNSQHELCNCMKYNFWIWMGYVTMQVFNFIFFPVLFYSMKCHVIHRLRLCMRKYKAFCIAGEKKEPRCAGEIVLVDVIRCCELCCSTTLNMMPPAIEMGPIVPHLCILHS